MSIISKIKKLSRIANSFVSQPGWSLAALRNLPEVVRGNVFAEQWRASSGEQGTASSDGEAGSEGPNPLREYFENHKTGKGIWKWHHYFEIYHRHFAKFVGREVHIAEVGIFSGGSLDMWKEYFGPKCHVYGIDIEPACKAYEGDRVKVFIGDQADRSFWRKFREQVPVLDILVDDGGHLVEQQIATFEEILPHLRPGGVFLCEDVHTLNNPFMAYTAGYADGLNTHEKVTTGIQRYINSVHLYPYATVVEKNARAPKEITQARHGTEWQPFLYIAPEVPQVGP